MAGPAESNVAEDIIYPKTGKCAGDGTFPLLIIVVLICVFCLQCLKMRQDDVKRIQKLMDEAERKFKAAIASRSRRGCVSCSTCKCRRHGNFRTDEEIRLERAKFYAEAFAKLEVTIEEVMQQRYEPAVEPSTCAVAEPPPQTRQVAPRAMPPRPAPTKCLFCATGRCRLHRPTSALGKHISAANGVAARDQAARHKVYPGQRPTCAATTPSQRRTSATAIVFDSEESALFSVDATPSASAPPLPSYDSLRPSIGPVPQLPPAYTSSTSRGNDESSMLVTYLPPADNPQSPAPPPYPQMP